MCLKYFISRNVLHLKYLSIWGSRSGVGAGGRACCGSLPAGAVLGGSCRSPACGALSCGHGSGVSIPCPALFAARPRLPPSPPPTASSGLCCGEGARRLLCEHLPEEPLQMTK